MRHRVPSFRPLLAGAIIVVCLVAAASGSSVSARSARAEAAPDQNDEPVIDVSFVDATEAGVTGIDRLVVMADGRVFESADTVSGWQTIQIPPEVVSRLGDSAVRRGLLDAVDFGDPGITDQGWVTATFDVDAHRVDHYIYAPEYIDFLTESQVNARRQFGEFVTEIRATVVTEAAEPPSAHIPEALSVTAVPLAADRQTAVTASRWPFETSVRALFGATGCTPVTMDDAERLLAIESWSRTAAGGRIVVVDTGLTVPRRLFLTIEFPLPFEDVCPEAGAAAGDASLVAPWPGDDRRPADAWSRWIAWAAVERLAQTNQLGPDANGTSDLSWYDASYSVADVDGRTVVDMVAVVGFGSRTSPAGFSVRVDLESGEVVAFETV